MKFGATISLSLRALSRHPSRAILTTLGIVISIAAVITVTEIGQGSSTSIKKTVESMGVGNIFVQPGSFSAAAVRQAAGSRMSIKPGDVEAIMRDCPSVSMITPIVWTWRYQVSYANRNWQPGFVVGGGKDYLKIRNWNLLEGRDFTAEDIAESAAVCIIGKTVAAEIFEEGESPVGKIIRVRGHNIRIIGLLEEKGANMGGNDQDDFMVLPWTTVRQRMTGSSSTVSLSYSTNDITTSSTYASSGISLYPDISAVQQQNTLVTPRFSYIDGIMAAAVDTEHIEQAIEEISAILRIQHRIREGERDDFSIINFNEGVKMMTGISGLMTNLLMGVALISLVVGGVGIMNIMLVSVTERTREIGLRMAVGAKAGDILQQFLTEAILLCLMGGIVGILLGHGAAKVVEQVKNWPVEGSIIIVIIAVAVSGAVGIVFGFYPALKASRLDPIEALRYE